MFLHFILFIYVCRIRFATQSEESQRGRGRVSVWRHIVVFVGELGAKKHAVAALLEDENAFATQLFVELAIWYSFSCRSPSSCLRPTITGLRFVVAVTAQENAHETGTTPFRIEERQHEIREHIVI